MTLLEELNFLYKALVKPIPIQPLINGFKSNFLYSYKSSVLGCGLLSNMNTAAYHAFQPSDVGGLILSLDAALGITKDGGDLVSDWADQTSQGNDVVQATGTKQPLWVANVINTLPVVRFDGVDNIIASSAFSGGNVAQPNYWFMVISMPTAHFEYMVDSLADTNRQFVARGNDGASTFDMFAGTELETFTISTSILLYSLLWDGASSVVRRSKSAYLSGDPGANDMAGITLGARWSDAGWGDLDIAEILIYDNDVGTANRDLIEDFLTTKYGL